MRPLLDQRCIALPAQLCIQVLVLENVDDILDVGLETYIGARKVRSLGKPRKRRRVDVMSS